MPTQEEIKAAIERVKSDKEAINFVRGPVTQIFDWQTLADAYIAGHDDTPITLDEATELCKGSKYIMVATFTGSDVFAGITNDCSLGQATLTPKRAMSFKVISI